MIKDDSPTLPRPALVHAFSASRTWGARLTIDHPVLAGHRAYGQALLPGLAWIDLLYQWFAEVGHGPASLALKNLVIHRPLIVSANAPVDLAIEATAASGIWKIIARQNALDAAERHETPYVTAEMHPVAATSFEETVDLANVLLQCRTRMSLDQVYEQCRARGLLHTGIMAAKADIYRTADATWVHVKVDRGPTGEGDPYLFHPALIDGSAIAASGEIDQLVAAEQCLYLPLFYESFRASRQFGAECFTRIPHGSIQASGELVSFSMELFSPEGIKLGELSNLKNKRVRHPASINPLPGARAPEEKQTIPATGSFTAGTSMETFIQGVIANKLGLRPQEIALDRGYYEMGLTSVMLLQVVGSIESALAVSLPPTLLFEHTTISTLSAYLSSQCGVAAMLQGARAAPESSVAQTKVEQPRASTKVARTTHSRLPVQATSSTSPHAATTDLAVIGLAGRYPQASNIQQLWENLRQGRDCITEVPSSRWRHETSDHFSSPSGKRVSRWGGFIDDVDCFDPQFFRMSARETEAVDPQERLFLEVCWEAIEDAGYTPDNLVGADAGHGARAVGVFVGVMHKDYSFIQHDAALAGQRTPISSSYAPIPNRVSYFCNFHGPSIAIDTVCSASLTAVHLARQSILAGECKVALAGGVNLSLHSNKYRTYGMMDMHSSDGRCRSFGHGGDGYVSAEGVGAVLLKRLDQALADGDHIYAVVKGSSINHGGTVSGITVPSPVAQGELIANCLRTAGIDPETIGYIEAHGTGTSLGDPIELQGLSRAFRKFTDRKQFCALGSVKSNMGHAESAAGISGLTKAILQLHHATLVKSLHAETVNPHLDLASSPFYLQKVTEPWPLSSPAQPRRAGVSSFGATGSNAHVILEEFPTPQRAMAPQMPGGVLLPLSALNPERLRAYVERLLVFLRDHPQTDLRSLAFTLQTGRIALKERYIVLVESVAEATHEFSKWLEGTPFGANSWQGSVGVENRHASAFTADEDLRETIGRWMAKGKWDKLAELWVEGCAIDWSRLYGERLPGRISAPTYPFAKERYWVDVELEGATAATQREGARETPPLLLFEERWEEQPLTSAIARPEPGRTLVFANARLREQIESDDGFGFLRDAILVREADEYREISNREFACRPDSIADIETVLRRVTAQESAPIAVIHAWAMGRGEAGIQALFSVFKAVKPLADRIAHITLIGRYDPARVETCWDYSWIGFERSLRLVLPNLRMSLLFCSSLSCTPGQLQDASTRTGVIWYDAAKRFSLSCEQIAAREATGEVPLRVNGQYLITGGCGGLGFKFAHYLARSYQAKLILVGRTPLCASIQEKLDALIEAGAAEARYHSVDISNTEALTAWGRTLTASLSGIIHAAGVESRQAFFEKSPADIEQVMRPKTVGTLLLDEIFGRQPLDFICYFSSSSAILGDLGSGDYAMANRFQMAYGVHRRRHGNGKTIVINWPLWREGGMGQGEAEQTQFYLKSSGQEALESAAGIDLWLDILRQSLPQILVMAGSPPRMEQLLQRIYRPEQISESGAAPPELRSVAAGTGWKAHHQGLSLEECIALDLKQLISTNLKTSPDKLDLTTNLADYGFDSLSLGTFAKQLSEHFSLQFAPALFFSHATIAQLVDHLLRTHQSHIQTFYRRPEVAAPIDDSAQPAQVAAKRFTSATPRVPSARLSIAAPEPIAVIGISGRFPKARTVDEMWACLAAGKSAITEIPASRWNWRDYFTAPGDKGNRMSSNRGGFIEGVDEFDPLFFEVSPREAQDMDPGERLLLMEAYKAVEDAGLDPASLRGSRTGLFVGMEESQYSWRGGGHGITTGGNAMVSSRLSYFLDLHGPTIATNTACSSGLVALYQAVMSLRAGECDSALVAGVALTLSPGSYVMMSQAGMISRDGECYSFSAKANGIGVGEAVVVLMLRPLSAAIAAGHSIYGTIKASGINFDGKTNGVTAPNGRMQSKLIEDIYDQYGIDAGDVTHLIAHGTGTKLGDAVELNALDSTFKKLLAKQASAPRQPAHCALTSCKSNFGHTMATSGLVSVVGLLKGMQHHRIPASLHCEDATDAIAWNDSPFYLNTETREWRKQRNRPHLGAVSSFGRSGTNAHVVLEEYAQADFPLASTAQHIVPLSARTAECLRQKARDLLSFLREEQPAMDLRSLAYTLQVGREAMEERLAFIVSSTDQLAAKLQAYVQAEQESELRRIEGIFRGGTSSNAATVALFNTDADLQLTIDKWIADAKLSKLLELWVQGLMLDWNKLHEGAVKPRRIRLPTYPFAAEKYWIGEAESMPDRLATDRSAAVLHPLLHVNTSSLSQQCYRTTFQGNEVFLEDHRVKGTKVLPGVAYLEMARAAVQNAVTVPESSTLTLRNIVWARPIVVTGPVDIGIALSSDEGGHVDFEIHSGKEGEQVVHCQGQAAFVPQLMPRTLDIGELDSRMQRGRLDPGKLYGMFAEMGLEYGPAFRGVSSVCLGDGQLLARLHLAADADVTRTSYELHPGMMDSALQSAIGLAEDLTRLTGEPLLPFALDEICILSGCTDEMLAWVRYASGTQPDGKVIKLDVDLCDTQGNVCVQMRGLSSRVLRAEAGSAILPSEQTTNGLLLATPVWKSTAVSTSDIEPVSYEQRYVLLFEMPQVDARALEETIAPSQCIAFQGSAHRSIAERYVECALACFERLQSILRARPTGNVLVQAVMGNQGEDALFAGLSGLFRTAGLENPRLKGQIILSDPQATTSTLAAQLLEDQARYSDFIIRHERGERSVLCWEPVTTADGGQVALKNDGLYLVTGGLGGLGRLFAEEILRQTTHAKVILTGRSALTAQKQAVLNQLAAGSGRVDYRQLDLNDLDQVRRLIAEIDSGPVRLTGILHCAGMIRDRLILQKDTEELRQVLAPKVLGTFNLDQASKDVELDFLALFSSASAVFGNPGQADYAAANGFLDQFAVYRNQLAARNERRGFTLAIDWPFWEAGGMSLDRAQLDMLKQQTGMRPLPTASGLHAFRRCLALSASQALVLEGDLPRLRQALATGSFTKQAAPQPEWTPELTDDGIEDLTQRFLCKQFAEVLKLPADRIDPRAALEKYGIDSILALELTNQLEKTFGSLSKTLLFEYRTLCELAEYFITAHRETLHRVLAKPHGEVRGDSDRMPNTVATVPKQAAARFSKRTSQQSRDAAAKVADSIEREPIAIIGLSGRYPQAFDLREYWHNLRDGRDCITEVPRERWDWQEFFSDDRSGAHRSKWGGFIAGVDEFDAAFFGMSPQEAERIDPQERMFLQHAWIAMEDAGYSRERLQIPHGTALPGQVGVYVGVMYSEYPLVGIDAPVPVSGSYASIANRVSYALNVRGPSLTLDSMCSSSLSAIHLACQDLIQQRTDLAIAGGVNLSIHPNKYRLLSAGRMISTQAQCESFGEGGDGYVPGEGVGVVVLQRLSDAVANGSPIYGLIKGSALNHAGKTNSYGVPDPRAQAEVIDLALASSRTDCRHVSYIEAHGTGTMLGDPIEITALNRAFQQRPATQKCLIGSAKSNIGHLEAAAGIAALTKVLMQMKHRQIVPSLHSATLNPHIDFAGSPFVVNQSLTSWERPVVDRRELPRIAGVSCFGAGGTNAHMIVQEYIPPAALEQPFVPADEGRVVIVPLSARTPEQLLQKAADLLEYIQQHQPAGIDLISMAYTLQVGREPMEQRAGFIVSSVGELAQRLGAFTRGELEEHAFCGSARESHHDIATMLRDDDIQEAIDRWIVRGKLPKLLELWCKGLVLDWRKLYAHDDPARSQRRYLNLPAYPFARERHWIEARKSEVDAGIVDFKPRRVPVTAASGVSERPISRPGSMNKADLFVRRLVAEQGHEILDEAEASRSFHELGLNSLALVNVSRSIQQQLDAEFELSALFEHGTVGTLAAHLAQKYPAELASLDVGVSSMARKAVANTDLSLSSAPARSAGRLDLKKEIPPDSSPARLGTQFPELVHLNQSREGRPVFWFHGGLGGVQPYHVFADAIERPFYGIQARGYQTDRAPLRGIQAMAAYYIHVLRSVQPEGPYDLGGYSMGGMIAYEVARQLQELGQVTDTIVMLDTLDHAAARVSSKDDILLGVNSALLPLVAHDLERLRTTLIHRREVDASLDDDAFMECLIRMALERGLRQDKDELATAVSRTIGMLQAYEIEKFQLLPLKAPHATTCYYFRNKSGLFLGEMQPFYSLADATTSEEPSRYWEGWQHHLPNMHVMDVDAPSHALFFLEPKVVASVAELCNELYSAKGWSSSFLEPFKVRTRQRHGT